MDREDIDQPGERERPQHLLLWRGQQQVTLGVPGLLPPAHEGCYATA